jgi:predicted nucleic acid-binding protein
MKHCVALDSCFLIATTDPDDAHHADALNIFNELLKETTDVTIIVPPIALYETISTLIRNGFTHDEVEKKIMYLLRTSKIITISLTETSAFRHAEKLLSPGSPANSLRNADYMIACVGLDFEAQILTFDRKMRNRIKPAYSHIYYCSSADGKADETSDFLYDLQLLAP